MRRRLRDVQQRAGGLGRRGGIVVALFGVMLLCGSTLGALLAVEIRVVPGGLIVTTVGGAVAVVAGLRAMRRAGQ